MTSHAYPPYKCPSEKYIKHIRFGRLHSSTCCSRTSVVCVTERTVFGLCSVTAWRKAPRFSLNLTGHAPALYLMFKQPQDSNCVVFVLLQKHGSGDCSSLKPQQNKVVHKDQHQTLQTLELVTGSLRSRRTSSDERSARTSPGRPQAETSGSAAAAKLTSVSRFWSGLLVTFYMEHSKFPNVHEQMFHYWTEVLRFYVFISQLQRGECEYLA